MDEFNVSSTSKQSAKVEDRELSRSTTTRRVVRAELVDNPNDPNAGVKVTILHQRKGKNDAWEDPENAVSMAALKAGEVAKFSLTSAETLRLRDELGKLFELRNQAGVPMGERSYVVGPTDEVILADPTRAAAIRKLLAQNHAEAVWRDLVEQNPGLVTKLARAKLHDDRVQSLKELEAQLAGDHDEAAWQKYFERNTWVFGYGLDYRFLTKVSKRPYVGGKKATGSGGSDSDFLMASKGQHNFTVLVEIKKPSTELLDGEEYRNGVFRSSRELAGGISQVQVCCRRWEESARSEANEGLRAQGIMTVQPKGILVVGRLGALASNDARRSFELIRRNLVNPEIVTFDELLERARFIVAADEPRVGSTDVPF